MMQRAAHTDIQKEEHYTFVAESSGFDRELAHIAHGRGTSSSDSSAKVVHQMSTVPLSRFMAGRAKTEETKRRKGNEQLAKQYYAYRA